MLPLSVIRRAIIRTRRKHVPSFGPTVSSFFSSQSTSSHAERPVVLVQDSLRSGGNVPLRIDREGVVTFYCCGPTVYDSAHLGHARTYVHFDTIRRILQDVCGMSIAFFMNITDVDLKILHRAQDSGQSWDTIATKFEKEFFEDMKRLGVQKPTYSPRATEYMDEIIAHIESLLECGLAYVGKNSNSVYFDTEAFNQTTRQTTQQYGALDPSRREGTGEHGGDIEEDFASEKKRATDFALWKVDHRGEFIKTWPSPWGEGLPGWHSECTAMVSRTAGLFHPAGRANQLDIHGGGIDLRFPHHENERAQGQGLHNACCSHVNRDEEDWSTFFLHTGHLHVKGKKMSKSLKNFYTIRQLLGEDPMDSSSDLRVLTPRQARVLFLQVKYNQPMELESTRVDQVVSFDNYISEFYRTVELQGHEVSLQRGKWGVDDVNAMNTIEAFSEESKQALLDDFNTPKALGLARQLVRDMNKYARSEDHPKLGVLHAARSALDRLFAILGIGGPSYANVEGYGENHIALGLNGSSSDQPSQKELIEALLAFRDHVRFSAKHKDISRIFALCDEMRDHTMKSLGVRVEDQGGYNLATWTFCKRSSGLADGEKSLQDVSYEELYSKPRNNPDNKDSSQEKKKPNGESKEDVVQKDLTVEPKEYYRTKFADSFAEFDEQGIPTLEVDGTPVSKNKRKKLVKKLNQYTAERDEWIASAKNRNK